MKTDVVDKAEFNPYATPAARVHELTAASSEAPFFPVSLLKLSLMSLVTFGLYEVYWFYKNWKCVQRLGDDVNAPIRALFYPLVSYRLYRRIRDHAKQIGIERELWAGSLAVATFIASALWRLPEPWWLIGLFAFLPMVPVQSMVNDINRQVAPDADRNARFGGWNIFGLVVGGILFLLTLIGTFFGE